MNNKIIKIFLFLIIAFSPLLAVHASSFATANSVVLKKNQIIAGSYYVSGQNVIINGRVSGDLVVIAKSLTINNSVGGDLIALAQKININAPIRGNVRVISDNLTINNIVARNVDALANKITFNSNTHIGWDAYLLGQDLDMQGILKGNLTGRFQQAIISGKIGKNLKLKLDTEENQNNLIISPQAIIKGNVIYTSQKTANISKQATILGEIQKKIPTKEKGNFWLIWLWTEILAIFSALIVGLVLIFVAKDFIPKIFNEIQKNPVKKSLSGLVLLIALPITALILTITLIGIPLALIIVAFWLIAVYLAKILIAILIGQIIIKNLIKKPNPSLFWPLVVGVIISYLLFSITIIGWILALIAVCLVWGNIWTYVNNK